MAYTTSSVSYSDLQEPTSASSDTATSNPCCSKASADLKLYQAFIFSIPIFFTFILLSLFYLFYLRRRRVDWSSIRMRSNHSSTFHSSESDDTSRVSGLFLSCDNICGYIFYVLFVSFILRLNWV